jgi:hypothetical protein
MTDIFQSLTTQNIRFDFGNSSGKPDGYYAYCPDAPAEAVTGSWDEVMGYLKEMLENVTEDGDK